MKLITVNKIYNTLKYEQPEVILSDEIIKKARRSIDNMLEISKKLNL
jgi:quinolinate synthase